MNYIVGVAINEVFEKAATILIDNLMVKVIDIRHLLKNKESLNRTGIKELTDKQDILTLRIILKEM
jgi:rRNA processing protein Krr1/Pno1